MRMIFAGSGEFGAPTLARLAATHEIALVVSQPDRPSGRGRKLAPTPISQLAAQRNLPLLRTESINAENLPEADVMVVIAFGQKVSRQVADRPRLGSINLHASLLPECRGAAPIHWAILRGHTMTGNSVIRLADRMDAGAILAQSYLNIGPAETTGELHDRLALDGVALVERVLDELAAGTARELPQDESRATQAPKLSRQMSRLDWSHDAQTLARQIRALSPWPGCRVRLLDAAGNELAALTLLRATAVRGEGPRWCGGEICSDGAVCCGDGQGAVEIMELQPSGGRPMPLADFRRGNPWMPGMRLEPVL